MTPNIKFGTDGWRAIIAEDFTFHNVSLVTAALAEYLRETYSPDKPLLIGYDTRFLAERFAKRAAAVMESYGRPVQLAVRDVPTPVIAHAAKTLDSAGAIQFTASHNPPEYLGIKYIPDYGGPATADITSRLEELVNKLHQEGYAYDKAVQVPEPERFEPKYSYMAALGELVDLEAIRAAKLRIGVDSLHGAGRGYLTELLDPEVALGQDIDPLFRGMLPEPKPACLENLTEEIRQRGLDIGLSNDGDADRFAIIDEHGQHLTPNQVLCILAKYLREQKGWQGAIVRTVSTTHLLDVLADKLGLPLVETPVGFKHIAAEMRFRDVLLGGEESGGLSVLGHIPEKDGILACLLMCEAVATTNLNVSQLWRQVVEFAGLEPASDRLDLHLADESAKAKLLSELKDTPPSQLAGRSVEEVSHKDGVKLYLSGNAWVLVRPSGTEPLLRVYLEAPTEPELASLRQDMQERLQVTS